MSFGLGDFLKFVEERFGRSWASFLAVFIGLGLVVFVLTQAVNFLATVSSWLNGIGIEPNLWDKFWYVGRFALGMVLLLLISSNLVSSSMQRRLERQARTVFHDVENTLGVVEEQKRIVEGNILLAKELSEEARLATDDARKITDEAIKMKQHYEAALAALPEKL